jgi:hypothetical protein
VPDSLPDADEAGDASAWEDEEQRPETDSASFPGSTDDGIKARFRPLDPSTRKIYAKAVEEGAVIASGLLNSRLDPDGKAFVMREQEAQGIAAPASRLLARHVPLSAAVAGQATDLSDIIELVTATVGYVMSAMRRRTGALVDGSGMPDGTEGDVSDWRDDGYGDHPDTPPAPGPMPAWPMPGMAPMVGSGSM